jgi:hypothetical protein
MIALTLVRVIERHFDELAAELVTKLGTSRAPPTCAKSRSTNCVDKSRKSCSAPSEWLLTKTGHDIEQRFFELGERRASQGSRSPTSAGQLL